MKILQIAKTIYWKGYRLFFCGLSLISPKANTILRYRERFSTTPNLKTPKTLNEKILWLKFNTYYNNQLVKQCADKYAVRKYIASKNCDEILNELLAVYETPEEIDWEILPNQFVIKLNIGCGFNHIVFNKEAETYENVINIINEWLKKSKYSYLSHSELQYKGIKPYILIEKYLGCDENPLPEDYKFYCLNGQCEIIMCCKERDKNGHNAKYIYLDRDWNLLTNSMKDPSYTLDKPNCLEEAIRYAEVLSKPFPFVRVDLYIIEGLVVFGELTFTPSAGMDTDHKLVPFMETQDLDHILGNKLELN